MFLSAELVWWLVAAAVIAAVMVLYAQEEDRRIPREIAEQEERDMLRIERGKPQKMREQAAAGLDEMRGKRAANERAISAPLGIGAAFVAMAVLSGVFTRAANAVALDFDLPPLPDWAGYVFCDSVHSAH